MDLRLSDIASTLQGDWVILAKHLGISDEEVKGIKNQYNTLSDQCLAMLLLWRQRYGNEATANVLEKALKEINRDDVVKKCIYNIDSIDDELEKAFAKTQMDTSGTFSPCSTLG
jgi:ankyrin